jgi:hypothetical protein
MKYEGLSIYQIDCKWIDMIGELLSDMFYKKNFAQSASSTSRRK